MSHHYQTTLPTTRDLHCLRALAQRGNLLWLIPLRSPSAPMQSRLHRLAPVQAKAALMSASSSEHGREELLRHPFKGEALK
jgi:hypothetical protein